MFWGKVIRLLFLCLGYTFWGCTPSEVILVADGRTFRKTDRDSEIDLRMHIFRLSNPDVGESEYSRRRQVLLDSAESHFIEETGLLRIADEQKLEVSADEVTNHLQSVLGSVNGLSEPEQRLLKDIARREILCAKVKKILERDIDVDIPISEFEQAKSRFAAFSKMVAATNALIYAHATNVWKEICGGMDFAEAASRYSEDVDGTSCKWGSFPPMAFASEPDLLQIVQKLHVGEVSPPVQGDNGLLIVRLKGVDTASPTISYDLERIFFKLPEEAPTMSSSELRQLLMDEKRRKGLSKRLCAMRQSINLVKP